MLDSNARQLAAYIQLNGRKKRLALLELLDAQQRFLHVMEHHEQREEKDLLPGLIQLNVAELLVQWQRISSNLRSANATFKNNLECYLQSCA